MAFTEVLTLLYDVETYFVQKLTAGFEYALAGKRSRMESAVG